MVSARACTYQFLPYNSSGINLFGKKTVQVAVKILSILTSFSSFGGSGRGVGGGGGQFGTRPKIYMCSAACRRTRVLVGE